MTVADITGGMALEEVRSQEIVARWEDIALEKVVRREFLWMGTLRGDEL